MKKLTPFYIFAALAALLAVGAWWLYRHARKDEMRSAPTPTTGGQQQPAPAPQTDKTPKPTPAPQHSPVVTKTQTKVIDLIPPPIASQVAVKAPPIRQVLS